MLGTSNNPGVLPCAIRDVFQGAERNKNTIFSFWVSYLEIYNEQVNDLLNPKSQNLKLVDDQKWGTDIKGIKMERVWNFEQTMLLLNYGEEHRKYRETNLNDHSSRSHTVFRIVFIHE